MEGKTLNVLCQHSDGMMIRAAAEDNKHLVAGEHALLV